MGSGPMMRGTAPFVDELPTKPQRALPKPKGRGKAKPISPTGPKMIWVNEMHGASAPAADPADRDAPNPNDPHVPMT